jgi:hypothetical protein
VPVDPKTLPQDAETLKRMLVDVTAQLDRSERLLRQLLQAKTGRRSEQLSREQLASSQPKRGWRCPSRKRRKTIQTKSRRQVHREQAAPSRAGGSRCRNI